MEIFQHKSTDKCSRDCMTNTITEELLFPVTTLPYYDDRPTVLAVIWISSNHRQVRTVWGQRAGRMKFIWMVHCETMSTCQLFSVPSRPVTLTNSMLCRMFTSDTLHHRPHLVAKQRVALCDNYFRLDLCLENHNPLCICGLFRRSDSSDTTSRS